MSLPNPTELIAQMATRLKAHLEHRSISEPRFIGIRTGGGGWRRRCWRHWTAIRPWAPWTYPSTATTSARTACTRRCARPPCRSKSKASIWC